METYQNTDIVGIVLARFGCEFGYPATTREYMKKKYPHKEWDWTARLILRDDLDLVAEVTINPKKFKGVTETDHGVIFDHELFVKYVPQDIIDSQAYRIDRDMCGEEYITVNTDKFQLYLNRKIMNSDIDDKLSKLYEIDKMFRHKYDLQKICAVCTM